MKFDTVEIANFMSIGYAKIVLSDRGLVLVQGENADDSSAISNGAGKSSIGDAVSWCNYGSTARGEDGDEVVNRTAGKGTRVVNTIKEGPITYEIARHRKHKTGKNTATVWQYEDGKEPLNLTKGTDKLTQEVINTILGCSLEVFWGAIYAGQDKMPDIPGMTDKQLKMLIEEASGATLLEAAYKEANTRLQAKKISLTAAEAGLNRAESELTAAIAAQASHSARSLEFESARIDSCRSLAASAKLAKDKADELISKRTVTTIEKSDADLVEVNTAIAAVAGEQEKLTTLTNVATAAGRVVDSKRHAERAAEQAVAKKKVHIGSLAGSVGCPCDTCARPFEAVDIAPARKLAERELAVLEEDYKLAMTETVIAQSAWEGHEKARDEYKASMTDLTATIERRTKILALREVIVERERAIADAQAEQRRLVAQVKAKRDELNPFTPLLEGDEDLITDRTDFVQVCKDMLAAVVQDLKVHTVAAQVFGPAGVRAFLLDEVTPFLNEQTAKYLGTLSDGNLTATWTTLVKTAKGELREKFAVELESVSAGGTFKSISGGEKRKVRIACAFALSDLVARRASKPIELFIGDEIDDALDSAGLERLTTILEEKGKERGTVLVISHRDLKSWIKQSITIKKTGGVATIVEAA